LCRLFPLVAANIYAATILWAFEKVRSYFSMPEIFKFSNFFRYVENNIQAAQLYFDNSNYFQQLCTQPFINLFKSNRAAWDFLTGLHRRLL
jgi:hypothetical protein